MKSYKIQLSVLLFLVVLDQFLYQQKSFLQFSRLLFNIIWKNIFVTTFCLTDSVNPNGQNLKCEERFLSPLSSKPKLSCSRKSFIEIKKSFGTHLFAGPILLTKFGLSVSLVWSPGLIENLTICDFQNSNQLPTFFLILLWPRSLKQRQILKWSCLALICRLPINFTLKNTFQFYVMLRKNDLCWEILVYRLLTVQVTATELEPTTT